jgi:hypothetical protein
VWIEDSNNASYVSGAASAQPNLTIGGRVIVGGGASLKNNGGTMENRTADGNGFAPLSALSFKLSGGPTWTSGAGAPTSACVTGSLYTRTDGAAKTTLYACEKGAWVAK